MPAVAAWISLLGCLFGPASAPECYALGGLDIRRASALASESPTALRAVYADATAAETDQRLLRQYVSRGLRIVSTGMTRSRCSAVARSARRVELDVTEKLASTWAVDDSGAAWQLPRDGFAHRRVVLTGGVGHWRIASVTE